MATLHVARWDNFAYLDQQLDRGQIVELRNARNDEKLLRLGYIAAINDRKPTVLECGECGAKFLEDAARDAHGRRRHPHRARAADMGVGGVYDPTTGEPSAFLDTEGDKEDRQRERDTPLYLDKTEASLKG